jgi:hypothetical protein
MSLVWDAHSFFEEVAFGYMCKDIERELNLARSGHKAGNFLCALGLLCYTEFMGGVLKGKLRNHRPSSDSFDEFLKYMGYKAQLSGINVYGIFRCGLAHEYFVKHECVISMLNATGQTPITVPGISSGGVSVHTPDHIITQPVSIGISKLPDGRYLFIVEQYHKDFRDACKRLLAEYENGTRAFPSQPHNVWWPAAF